MIESSPQARLALTGMVNTLTAILAAYLIGAIPFGLLIARAYGVKDIRTVGSGNIGATNVHRILGMKAAGWVYLLDIGKGVLVVLLARQVSQTVMSPEVFWVTVGMAAILGHVFPIYLRFKGGKGVATACGVLLVLLPVETLFAVVMFFAVLFLSRYVSVASMAAALTFPAVVSVEQVMLDISVSRTYWILAFVIAVLVPVTHHKNIRRLLTGTENRIGTGRDGGIR